MIMHGHHHQFMRTNNKGERRKQLRIIRSKSANPQRPRRILGPRGPRTRSSARPSQAELMLLPCSFGAAVDSWSLFTTEEICFHMSKFPICAHAQIAWTKQTKACLELAAVTSGVRRWRSSSEWQDAQRPVVNVSRVARIRLQ